MNVARAYEARCDLAQGLRELEEAQILRQQEMVDDEIDKMTDVYQRDQSCEAITAALDEHVDPAELLPLLANLHLAIKAEHEKWLGSKGQFRKALGALDQFVYDAISAEAQAEVSRRNA